MNLSRGNLWANRPVWEDTEPPALDLRNIAITHRYIAHLYPGAVIDVMNKRVWTNEEDVA